MSRAVAPARRGSATALSPAKKTSVSAAKKTAVGTDVPTAKKAAVSTEKRDPPKSAAAKAPAAPRRAAKTAAPAAPEPKANRASSGDLLLTPFVLVLGQLDAVPALKTAALAQGFRPSYQRRGLLTLKTDNVLSPLLPTPFASAFARFCAPCFGRLDDAAVAALAAAVAARTGRAVRLHMVGGERPAALSGAPFLAPSTKDAIEAGTPVITLIHDDTARWTTLHLW